MVVDIMILIFIVGYVFIAFEHKLKVNKAATALITAGILWVVYITASPTSVVETSSEMFKEYLVLNPHLESLSLVEQCVKFIVDFQIIDYLGEVSETLFFLMGAMTIVEIIDVHGGFSIITNRITTRDKRRLLWILACITFFMSAVLDNMTTAIVMVMLVRRIVPNYIERWVYASVIIIAANSGGAWSPIGDVTTIMLWVKGNVTTVPLIKSLLLPCIVSTVVPVIIASRILRGKVVQDETVDAQSTDIEKIVTDRERTAIFAIGVGGLLLVPVFKTLTHLPPFMGVLIVLGVLWVYTELIYRSKVNVEEDFKHRVTRVIRRIDTPTILFFLGILMAVNALSATGVLGDVARFLDDKVHNVYIISVVIGIISSVVDNVPLVAGSISMYPLVEPGALSTMADPAFMQHFVQDGTFWLFLAYCAGVGGSILIIGSVAGVVTMGIERINFAWYLKNIALMALTGYLAGAAVFILQELIFGGGL